MPFIKCVLYLAAIGVGGFLLGRVLPKGMFNAERFPYRPFGWERQGAVYDALGVRRWKERVPDMSAILPKLMPSKHMPANASSGDLLLMIRETCVAEFIHGLLCAAGFGCAAIWRGWGWALSVLYALVGNVPYIVIQRYNRPKLTRILRRVQARENVHEKCDDTELRHGTGA